MTDPLSFVASIVAVTTLAETVVTKGYQYLKVAKDCSQDVRRLMAEVNVLCGVLDRLGKFLQDRESDNSVLSEHDPDNATPVRKLGIPDFVHECQKTLGEIQDILQTFSHLSNSSSPTEDETLRSTMSRLRNLKAKDLKWPLSKSKTLELINSLERHKATCTVALAGTGLVDVHSILKETKLSNKHLAEIRAKQETMLKLQLSQEQEKAMSWISPVDAATKHRAFARERQEGTGMWLFDVPEMTHWLETPNSALWVYGIPGAGKTTLSTLVVDEILTRKRSKTVGTAYFYIRHDDRASHQPSNVLGSLIFQLACQSPEALAELMELYDAQYQISGSSAPPPPDDEMIEAVHSIARHFSETYIMIDGLDECGTVLDSNRALLINTLAQLCDVEKGSTRIIIFSRDENDIRKRFVHMKLQTVCVAARSADLRLFVNAWLVKLDVQSASLKIEIVDRLVDEAKG
ncbi:MAG: hypothetical protein Q9169_008172, partial [Polycauliona sp. 2 TL-2023]